ncbi:MAG: copper resistance protein CopC [Candidatus Limnocylindria bacterium]
MVAVLAYLVIAPASALAHAELVTTSPTPNASLVDAPEQVAIIFSEPIDPATGFIELLDPQLRSIDDVGVLAVDRDGGVASVVLPPLDPGIYTVRYQVVSTVDGHATEGQFSFIVDPTGADAPPTNPPSSSSPSVDGWTVAARWLALISALIGLGTLTIWGQAVRPAIRSLAPGAEHRPPWRVFGFTGAGTAVGLVCYLALSARGSNYPIAITALFGSTPFAATMRMAILFALAAAVLALIAARRRGDNPILAVGIGACFAVSLGGMSAAGHASSLGGPVNVAVDWLHLVAAAAWIGGLPMVYPLATRVVAFGGSRRTAAAEILRRHGRMALIAGPLVVLTGLANSPLVLGTSRELVASDYGNLLLVKAMLVSVALGIGAASHLLVRGRGRGSMAILLTSELLVAAVAVMAAATMVTIQPAAARQPTLVGPSVQPAHFYGAAGPSDIHASVSVPAPGRQSYQVTIRDATSGRPQSDIEGVALTFTPPAEIDRAPERVVLDTADLDALYTTSGAHTPIAGEWSLDISVVRTGRPDDTISFDMRVSEPSEPVITAPPATGVGVPAPLAMLWGILPSGIAGWVPAVVIVAGVVIIGPRRSRLAPLRGVLVAAATILVLAVGSRSVVEAANTPTADDLVAYERSIAGSVDDGERIFLANCASCHATDGDGDGPVRSPVQPEPLAERVPRMSDAEVSYRIANGLVGTPMPAFAANLTETERLNLVSYLRQRWGAP